MCYKELIAAAKYAQNKEGFVIKLEIQERGIAIKARANIQERGVTVRVRQLYYFDPYAVHEITRIAPWLMLENANVPVLREAIDIVCGELLAVP